MISRFPKLTQHDGETDLQFAQRRATAASRICQAERTVAEVMICAIFGLAPFPTFDEWKAMPECQKQEWTA